MRDTRRVGLNVVKGIIDFGLDTGQERVKEPFTIFVGSEDNSDAMTNTTADGFRYLNETSQCTLTLSQGVGVRRPSLASSVVETPETTHR
jgi:hypothetical protein